MLTLCNPVRPELAKIEVKALADTGAMHLCLPEHVACQLELAERDKREVTLADGSKMLLPYVGPVEVRFGNRRCCVGAIVLGDEVLLGAIPMADMDLVVRPLTREVLVNPATPNIGRSLKKGDGWDAGTMPSGKRIGVAKDAFKVPDSIDVHNDEVAHLFLAGQS